MLGVYGGKGVASPLCSKVALADSVEDPLEAPPLCSKVALADSVADPLDAPKLSSCPIKGDPRGFPKDSVKIAKLLRGGIDPPSVLLYVYTCGRITLPSVKYTTFRGGEHPQTSWQRAEELKC